MKYDLIVRVDNEKDVSYIISFFEFKGYMLYDKDTIDTTTIMKFNKNKLE